MKRVDVAEGRWRRKRRRLSKKQRRGQPILTFDYPYRMDIIEP